MSKYNPQRDTNGRELTFRSRISAVGMKVFRNLTNWWSLIITVCIFWYEDIILAVEQKYKVALNVFVWARDTLKGAQMCKKIKAAR